MKYAVLSDIHANYEALKVVLEYLEKNSVDKYIICGDIIGYGPQPVECINEIRKIEDKSYIVLGNHDAAITGKIDLKWFNEYARKAIEITIEKIDKETLEWFSKLPEKIETEEFTVVHGSLKNHLKEYLLSELQYRDMAGLLKSKVLFFGHSHIPMCFYTDGNKYYADFLSPFAKVDIVPENKMFINPGSVGQPRDGNPMASFGIYDTEKQLFELIRLSYNIAKVQNLMKEAGMPELLIYRLELGY